MEGNQIKFHLFSLLKGIKNFFNDKEVRVLLIIVFLSIVFGGIAYHYFEGWSFFDSVYFSVITLTTIGFGDFYPVTFAGKLFTIFYVFIGIGIIFLFINKVSSNAIKQHPAIKVIEKDKNFKQKIKIEEKKIQKETEKPKQEKK